MSLMNSPFDWRAVDCPKCGANAGESCRSPDASVYLGTYKGGRGHKARASVALAARRRALDKLVAEGVSLRDLAGVYPLEIHLE